MVRRRQAGARFSPGRSETSSTARSRGRRSDGGARSRRLSGRWPTGRDPDPASRCAGSCHCRRPGRRPRRTARAWCRSRAWRFRGAPGCGRRGSPRCWRLRRSQGADPPGDDQGRRGCERTVPPRVGCRSPRRRARGCSRTRRPHPANARPPRTPSTGERPMFADPRSQVLPL